MFHVKGFGDITFDDPSLNDFENLDGVGDQIMAILLGFADVLELK